MLIVVHEEESWKPWRSGVVTRMRASALVGSHQLCIFEQISEPAAGAPTHIHAVEEVLEVIQGTAEVWVGDEMALVKANHSVIVPAGTRHGYRNADPVATLHTRATFAANIYQSTYDDQSEASLRYIPGDSGV